MNELSGLEISSALDLMVPYCFAAFDTLHIQPIPWNNSKGYTFMSIPCFCYSSLCKRIHDEYGEYKDSPLDLLLSDKRVEFLNKIIHNDFELCTACPKYQLRSTTGFWRDYDFKYFWGEYGKQVLKGFQTKSLTTIKPHSIGFNLDDCCNLACPTCRSKLITQHYEITDEDMNQLIYMAKQVDEISIGGNGEFFASHNYDKLLAADLTQDSKLKSIILYTNGTLFNENNWNHINENTRKLIKEIKISVDAANENTYKKVRGDKWQTLLNNLVFINKLKAQYGFKLSSTFTISKYNVSDVNDFYSWAINNGFNMVCFAFAREIFHKETGEPAESFIIPVDKRTDIYEYLQDLQRKESTEKVVIE